jgi:hypothetical protein
MAFTQHGRGRGDDRLVRARPLPGPIGGLTSAGHTCML